MQTTGARRFAALNKLAKEKSIRKTFGMRCRVVDGKPSPNKSTALWRTTPRTVAELRVNDDRAIRRRASRVRRPTRGRATRHNSEADSSLPSRSRSSSGSSRSQDNRNSRTREQMQPRASSLEGRSRPDRQVNL